MSHRVCLYFQVHQPFRLRDLRITEIGTSDMRYFDDEKNRMIFRKVAEKCYLPTNALLLEIIQGRPDFRVAFSLSGVFLDQCKLYGEDVLASFQALAKTGNVEFLAETYYHSLSCLTSLEEFCDEICQHTRSMQELFLQTPTVFRNTELIYSNELAQIARLMGFTGILAEGADHILEGRIPNVPYRPPRFRLPAPTEKTIRGHRPLNLRARNIVVLLKNYKLSDDIAFRFSDRTWNGYPLRANRFTDWIQESPGHVVNLFMDYETFGEHQWEDTGIFAFLRHLPEIWRRRGIRTVTPSEVVRAWERKPMEVYDAHEYISWADFERDLSAWTGNRIQEAALQGIYALEPLVKRSKNPALLDAWRKLLSSDHLYYMCTKYWSDGDVHKYFNPYDSPYEGYRRFSHALHDLRHRLEHVPILDPIP